jgi:hypothetical protein
MVRSTKRGAQFCTIHLAFNRGCFDLKTSKTLGVKNPNGGCEENDVLNSWHSKFPKLDC